MTDPELLALRQAIDEVDAKLLELLAARVKLVLEVGDWKRDRHVAVYDPDRERRMMAALTDRADPVLGPDTVRRVFERIIDESRRLEQRSMGSQVLETKQKE